MLRQMGNTAGALANLSSYDTTRQPILLKDMPSWRSACRTARQRKNQSIVEQKQIITLPSLRRILHDNATPLPIRQLVAIMWLTAARPGCALQLRRENLQWLPSSPDRLGVHFQRGKGAKFRGPYTIHTAIPPNFLPLLKPLIDDQTSRWLWIAPSKNERDRLAKQLNSRLKAENTRYAGYSLRRGALQHLAGKGMKAADLMSLSGHTTVKSLQTYLDFGKEFEWGAQRGRDIGLQLDIPTLTMLASPMGL